MRVKKMLTAALVVSVVGLTACSSEEEPRDDQGASATEAEPAEEESSEPSGADLDDVPDVVAEVNGEEIGRDEFVSTYEAQLQQQTAQAQASGQEVDEDALRLQVADNLVGTLLLTQAADERGFDASDQQVARTLQELAASSGLGSGDELVAALADQGLSEEDVLDQVETQVKVDQLVAAEAGDLEPTQAELREAYDAAVAQQEQAGGGAEVPPFQEVRPQVVEQVRAQRTAEATQTLVDQLREEGDVTINL